MPATGFIRGTCQNCRHRSIDLRAREGKIVCELCDPKPCTRFAIMEHLSRAAMMPSIAELSDEFCIADQTVRAHLDRLVIAGKLSKSDGRYVLANGRA